MLGKGGPHTEVGDENVKCNTGFASLVRIYKYPGLGVGKKRLYGQEGENARWPGVMREGAQRAGRSA